MDRRLLASLLLAAIVLVASPARATDPDRVEWSDDWPRVRTWEVVDAVVLTVGDPLFENEVPITSARWHGGILFDDWARGNLRGTTASAQSTASTVSDWMYYG